MAQYAVNVERMEEHLVRVNYDSVITDEQAQAEFNRDVNELEPDEIITLAVAAEKSDVFSETDSGEVVSERIVEFPKEI